MNDDLTLNEDIVLLTLHNNWQCDLPFGWVPITGSHHVPDTEVYDDEAFEPFSEIVRQAIGLIYNVVKVYNIEEGGSVFIKELSECFFGYDGLERMFTDSKFRFLLYFSHENSVTIGGRELLEEIHHLWPAYSDNLYS
ncbi:hypothetical protein GCM10027422_02540 [Hymenobacter arcticus]